MMVHTNPSTIDGRPSTMSVELMLTSLICVKTGHPVFQYLTTGPNNLRLQTIPVYRLTLHYDLIHMD